MVFQINFKKHVYVRRLSTWEYCSYQTNMEIGLCINKFRICKYNFANLMFPVSQFRICSSIFRTFNTYPYSDKWIHFSNTITKAIRMPKVKCRFMIFFCKKSFFSFVEASSKSLSIAVATSSKSKLQKKVQFDEIFFTQQWWLRSNQITFVLVSHSVEISECYSH